MFKFHHSDIYSRKEKVCDIYSSSTLGKTETVAVMNSHSERQGEKENIHDNHICIASMSEKCVCVGMSEAVMPSSDYVL